jgi:radical SAM protein with 4Fe4S-binding SPASM domain
MKAQLKPRINLDGRTALETVIPLATPYVVFVDPASACNYACKFCPTGHDDLISATNRHVGVMKFELFTKIIDDLAAFDAPIKVLRLYKDGEPLLNKRLADMIAYAKSHGVPYIDTTTNCSLITPARMGPILEAGLDKINLSVDGMSDEALFKFTGFPVKFDAMVENIRWLYEHRGACEVVIKIPDELLGEGERERFFDTFGDICDRISTEKFAPCWPGFDVEARSGIPITGGIYQQEPTETETCPYIFYSYSVNSDGLVSSCFLDWERKLVIGDVRKQSMKSIWTSERMQALRIQHLEGKRREHSVCSGCGQLSHCLPDNIDRFAPMLLERMQTL